MTRTAPSDRPAPMQAGSSGIESRRDHKLRTLNFVALLLTAAILGAQSAALPEESASGISALLPPVLLALFASAWCLFDGRMRHKEPMSVALLVIFLCFPVGLPAYCIWSRGLRGLFLGLGILALLGITMFVTAFALTLALGLPLPG